jgi:hypothetical protein
MVALGAMSKDPCRRPDPPTPKMVGSVPTTATAAGTATRKAIRKRRAAVGKKVTARNVAMMTMSDRAVQAGETTNIEAIRDTMRIVVTKAGAVPMTRTTVAPLRAAADMAAGLATPRAIPKPHAAVGKTVGNRRTLQQSRPWLRPPSSVKGGKLMKFGIAKIRAGSLRRSAESAELTPQDNGGYVEPCGRI